MEERNIEKYSLTQEELDFLIDLQHELNTQDTVSQADPRFWVVAGTQKVYVGKEYSEGEELCGGESVLADGIEEAIKYFQEEVIIAANEDSEDFEYILEEEPTRSFKSWKILQIDKSCDKNDEDYTEGDEILEEYNYIDNIEWCQQRLEQFINSPTPELFKGLKVFEFGPDVSKYQICELMNKAMMCTGFIKNIVEGNI